MIQGLNQRFGLVVMCALSLVLSACNDNGTANLSTQTEITDPAEAITQARLDAIDDEAESLWHLENHRDDPQDAATVAAVNEMSRRHAARLARSTGDYSFEPPPATPVSRPGKLLNIPAVTAPRFTVADRDWPVNAGDLSISMWSQDKLAAFSLSIDDNHVQDHAFWQEQADLYGWNWTWFVIANQVGWASHDHWGHWQKTLDDGHDIQTHTYSHLCDALFYTYREYRQSQAVINQNLDGANVVTMGYPFGVHTNKAGSPCATLDTARTANDRAEAAKHFLAARDVYGALSHPGRIDYMKVPSVSAARNFFNAAAHWANFDSALDSSSNNYRTWYVSHFHGLYGDANKQYVRDVLAYVKTKETDVWVGTFTEVAKYGQEYATAGLSNVQVNAANVQFELKDEMNDVWFNEPLTVKLRLPDGWSGSVAATQDGAAIPARVVQHGGQAYALVDAVPDQGLVVVGF